MTDAVASRILITGGSGFVGRALFEALSRDIRLKFVLPSRTALANLPPSAFNPIIRDINGETCWRDALTDVDVVVHCASRVHVMHETVVDPEAEFRRVNVDGTRNLAEQAAIAGVKRFIFLSSIKVNGESTFPGAPFSADSLPNPRDAYGRSKLEAERALINFAATSGIEYVVIRAPLVYGPGVKANFLTLMRWVHKGYPLPFALVDNRRSLVGIDNLVSLIAECIDNSAAANQIFLAGDGDDVSISRLLSMVGVALGHPARLFPVPVPLLLAFGRIIGKEDVLARLCGFLQADIGKSKTLLGWQPPVSVDSGLQRTAQRYLESI